MGGAGSVQVSSMICSTVTTETDRVEGNVTLEKTCDACLLTSVVAGSFSRSSDTIRI